MADVVITFSAPSELNDVRVAVVDLIAGLKAKKPILELVLGELKQLEKAVEGMTQIPADFAANKAASAQLAGYFGGQIVGVLLA